MSEGITFGAAPSMRSRTAEETPQPQYLRIFLRTPLAWALIAVLAGSVIAEARYREGNRFACAAVSMLLDRQIFREAVAGPGRQEIRILNACLEYAVPTTYDTRNIPRLSTVRRISDGLP
ncbi:MAG: hypothetical protein O2905_06365 [Proteobacteria bacterium]|nr:hypothetical protein [Pseudomonadota bacterium]